MTFRHKCRDRGCYIETQAPDWAFLEGAFARLLILPTDIDGFVETNGYFLTLEWKGTQAELTEGQVRAYVPRTSTHHDTVIVLYGDAQRTQCHYMRVIWGGRLDRRKPTTNKDVWNRCQAWSAWASKQPTVQRTWQQIQDALAKLRNEREEAAA